MSDKVKLRVDLTSKEDVANKVTSISSSSTNTHYPTAKAVYDALAEVTANSGGNYIYDFYHDPSTDDIVLEYDSASGSGSGGSGGTVTVDDSLSTTSTNPVQNKVITGALNGKANSSHTHTKSEITDFPSIPSKTSDLVNDGDGSNVFVKDNDSRLSNARTPLAHTHLSSDVTDLIDVIYPVGSIYMSVGNTSPSVLFGGTWEKIEDKFLLASGTSYSNGATGGSADAVVVSHNHKAYEDNFLQSNTALTRGGARAYTSQNTSGIYYIYSTNSNTNTTLMIHNTTQSSGESGTGKNMPPYIVVNVWKRTA